MKLFAQLYTALDETTKTNVKIQHLVKYFQTVSPEDAIWAIRFLIGRKPKQVVPTRKLKQWAAEAAKIPSWLFDASYEVVGDLAETIALVLPRSTRSSDLALHDWVQDTLLPLREKEVDKQRREIISAWQQMDHMQRFVWNKLITGGFRVGVSQKLVTRALSRFSGIEEAAIAHRLMGEWTPNADTYRQILSADTADTDISRPYPFYLAYPLEQEIQELGAVNQWHVEWKWDGIRAQLIKRAGQVFIWSRGEELVTEKYPEIKTAGLKLPDGTVIDGEILPWKDNQPLHFSQLQRRIGRKNVSRQILEAVPVVLMAYDLLELNSEDVRRQELRWRYENLAGLIIPAKDARLICSPLVDGNSWDTLAREKNGARNRGVEGLMLKRLSSSYRVGRKRGDWWKWKVDPLTVDAVLIYAQSGHGRKSGLYTDYTFGVWDQDKLVPFAKAYSGLTDEEIRQVDRFVRAHTVQRFGPVRAVKPELVFEIAFEDIRESTRHKSGVAVRFPRIHRWRTDKKTDEADSIETVRSLLTSSQDSHGRTST
jgi:DNA ligase-1